MPHSFMIHTRESSLSPGNSPEEMAFSKVNALALLNSFHQLSPRDKELIRMRHIDLMEFSDIAQALKHELRRPDGNASGRKDGWTPEPTPCGWISGCK